MKRLLTILIVGIVVSSSNAAIIKLKDGTKGKVDIPDTASLTDTLQREISVISKSDGKIKFRKSDVSWIILGEDTLGSKELYYSRIPPKVLMEQYCTSTDTCRDSYFSGQNAGANYNSTGWGMGGFGAGFCCGLIGAGATYGFAASSQPRPPLSTHPDSLNLKCYEFGYASTAKDRAKKAACIGGIAGTLLAVIFLFATGSIGGTAL